MLVTIRFSRIGDGIFVPHVDVMRNLNRIFRRAGIDVKYSQGFNKHMSLKLTQPLPFGVADMDCYATADIVREYSCEDLFRSLSENAPPYIEILGVYRTEKNPNLAGAVNASSYRVRTTLSREQILSIEEVKSGYVYLGKDGTERTVDDMIYSIEAYYEGLDITLCFGNKNLRVDLLTEQFNRDFGTDISVTDIVRLTQFVDTGTDIITAEEILERQCTDKYISKN